MALTANAQEESAVEEEVEIEAVEEAEIEEELVVPFAVIEEVPIFPGCEETPKSNRRKCFMTQITNHVSTNLEYPKDAKGNTIEGRVLSIMTIDTTGNITNIKMRGPHPALEKEAMRILKSLPQMTPGKQRGRNIAVSFTLPIAFRLE